MAHAEILNETCRQYDNEWRLCFQWCRYVYGDDRSEHGYRFIWRKPDGKLQPGRMQARLPSVEDALALVETAKSEGWGSERGDGRKVP